MNNQNPMLTGNKKTTKIAVSHPEQGIGKSYAKIIDNRPEINAQRKLKSIVQSKLNTEKVMQPKWIQSEKESGNMEWDVKLDGNTWFYNPKTDGLYYIGIDKQKSDEFKYEEWLRAGWKGLKERELEADKKRQVPGLDPRQETGTEIFLKMRNEGVALFKGIGSPGQAIDEDEVWNTNYKPNTEVDINLTQEGIEASVKTGYKASYIKRMQDHDATGRFHNIFNFPTGEIKAVDNHQVLKSEDQGTRKLNNNEVIYHQQRMAAIMAGKKFNIKVLLRKNVVNRVLEPVLRELKGVNEFTPDDDMFYALLSTPNVRVAVFMIKDQGKSLGISSISKIVVVKKDVYIHFV